MIVPISGENEVFSDFCVNCFTKKSERAVIEIKARGEMRYVLLSPRLYL
jgi:hypothetical protein